MWMRENDVLRGAAGGDDLPLRQESGYRVSNERPEEKMGTHKQSKWRKFTKAAWRAWPRKAGRKYRNDKPPRELRRSW